MHTVAGGQAAHKMAGVLEGGMRSGQHDVAQQRQLRVPQSRPVDGGDYRHFNVQQVAQQPLALPIGAVPLLRRAARHRRVAAGRPGETVAGPGHNHDFGFRVGTDGVKHLRQFRMRPGAPLQGIAVAVQRHLQDAVLPFQPGELKPVGVFVKMCH